MQESKHTFENDSPVPKVWLTTKEAAIYTGYSPETLAVYRAKGKGAKYYGGGRSPRYHIRDLDNWIMQKETPTDGAVGE